MRFFLPVKRSWLFFIFATAGILLWVALFVVADNKLETPWRVGGDAPYYVLLASNIARGRGFSYAGLPSAFRPPIYPLFLAAMMRMTGHFAFVAARLVQLGLGLLAVCLVSKLASRFFGKAAGRSSLVIGLFLPTIVFFPTELITETLAMLLAATFLTLVFTPRTTFTARRAAATALVVGIATLVRFNFGCLGIVAAWAALQGGEKKRAVLRLAVMAAVFIIVLAPWVVRNDNVFGRPLLSTQGGINALQGIVAPQGRAQTGDAERVRAINGWVAADIETNDPRRRSFGSEPQLDRRAWWLARQRWRAAGWRIVPLELEKLAYFWLSADQLISTRSFSPLLRTLRGVAVVLSWCGFVLAVLGWRILSKLHRREARLLIDYALIVTAIHMPFIMTSRYRIPFIGPAVILLAGAGLLDLWKRCRSLLGRRNRMGGALHTEVLGLLSPK